MIGSGLDMCEIVILVNGQNTRMQKKVGAWIHAADVYLVDTDNKSQCRHASLKDDMHFQTCTNGTDD